MDMTVLVTLSTMVSKQSKPTIKTKNASGQLLNYLSTHPNMTIRYFGSEMVLNIHFGALYLLAKNAWSLVCCHFFLGCIQRNGKSIKMNGAVFYLCAILRFVVASAAEAKLGTLFHSCREGKIIWLTLHKLCHPQPSTPIHCDDATATDIANNTVKYQQTWSMEMRFLGELPGRTGNFPSSMASWPQNLADYLSKHHLVAHHLVVHPWYLHTEYSPRLLPRAPKPSTLEGCVGTLPRGYTRSAPLPKVPNS